MKKLLIVLVLLFLADNMYNIAYAQQVITNSGKEKNKSSNNEDEEEEEDNDEDEDMDEGWDDGEGKSVEYKTKFANNKDRKVVFEMDKSKVTIEGYDGDELVVTALNVKQPPKRAQGLKPLYNTAEDNSGVGLSVTQENNVMRIVKASRHDARYNIKVPRKTAIMYEEVNWNGGNLSVANIEGDVEVKLNNSSMKLTNISGPISANTTNGNIIVTFKDLSQTKPSSIRATNGHIDVALPASTKANFKMSTHNGEIYTDFDVDLKNKGDLKRLAGGNTIEGVTNGGGVQLILSSINSDIYLRKKK
jgi:hypothetical protein